MKHWKIWPAAGVILAAGCGAEDDPGSLGGGLAMPPTPVETVAAQTRAVADQFAAIGTLEAGEHVTVVSQIDGTVTSLPFREGDPIGAGDVIARLDATQTAAEVRRAEAVLAQRRAHHDRVRAIVEKGAGAPQDLDDAAAALQVAEADLALQRARLDKTVVTAPFAGLVGTRRISAGAFVRAGEPLTDLARVRDLRLFFAVPERYLGKLRRGLLVTVTTTAFPGYELTGRIDAVEPVVDPGTRSARVMARLDNPERLLRPGMSADVTAILGQRASAVTVPSEAVFASGADHFAYVVGEDNTAMRRPLQLGTRTAEYVEVTGGIAAGELVVRAGHQKLYEGAAVTPLPNQPAP